ncbi:right-handed parallel beta-helix repeat-containing protein [Sorangium sp. So ce1128]
MVNRFWIELSAGILCGAACATVAGCGGDEPAPATCPEDNMVRGVCAGVPAGDVCGGERCIEGVACASVVDVANDEELGDAVAAASAGSCIALRSGRYGAVNLRGGVSLLGRSAAEVKIAGITLEAGDGAVLRGLTIESEGVSVRGATRVRIESLRAVGESGRVRHGVALYPGSSVRIVDSEITDSGQVGIFAENADVTLERSVISGAQGGGVVILGLPENGCDSDCTCKSRPALVAKSSVIHRNHIIGISLGCSSHTDIGITADSRSAR